MDYKQVEELVYDWMIEINKTDNTVEFINPSNFQSEKITQLICEDKIIYSFSRTINEKNIIKQIVEKLEKESASMYSIRRTVDLMCITIDYNGKMIRIDVDFKKCRNEYNYKWEKKIKETLELLK